MVIDTLASWNFLAGLEEDHLTRQEAAWLAVRAIDRWLNRLERCQCLGLSVRSKGFIDRLSRLLM